MRLFIGLAILAFTVGNVSARAQGKGDAQAGKTVYDSKCKICHGANGEGNPAMAKTLKVTFRPFASKEVQSKSDADLKKNFTEGNGKMPAVKGLSDKQALDLVAFIRSLAKS